MRTSVGSGAERYFALDFEPRPRVSYGLFPLDVDILRGAKVARKGYTIEELADLALVDGDVVEESKKENEETDYEHEANPNKKDFTTSIVVPERYERHEGVSRKEAEDKAKEVSIVVDPW